MTTTLLGHAVSNIKPCIKTLTLLQSFLHFLSLFYISVFIFYFHFIFFHFILFRFLFFLLLFPFYIFPIFLGVLTFKLQACRGLKRGSSLHRLLSSSLVFCPWIIGTITLYSIPKFLLSKPGNQTQN